MATSLQRVSRLVGTYGWSVFPTRPRSKIPYAGFDWKDESTNDLRKIANWARQYPDCNWAVDCGKSGLFIVDVDNKPDESKNGFKTLEAQGLNGLDHAAFIVRTPSGGMHYYYQYKGPTSASRALGPGLDTRGVGGYAVLPVGVGENGEPYEIVAEAGNTPGEPPAWVLERIKDYQERDRADASIRDLPAGGDFDSPAAVALAREYLSLSAPEAIEGQGGDSTTYLVACQLRDYGLSPEKSLELLTEIYNERCQPPWSHEELVFKVRNAFTYARSQAGIKDPATLFAGAAPEATTSQWARCASEIDISRIKPRDWLLGYRYLAGYVTLTVAPGGVGKSLWTILEGLSIASGKQITHDPVRQDGAVWIYNTEDPYDELERRIVAAARYHKLTRADTQRLYYTSGYDKPLTFAKYDEGNRPGLNEGLIGHMIGFIREKAIRLLIIDPFVECHQVKENDNDAINLVMQGFRRIALETGCALGLVHHSSKGTDANSRGNADKARGASALVSAARVAHTLYPMTSKEGKDYLLPAGDHRWYVRVDNAKSNLAPPTERYTWYKKQSVQLLFDADEDPTGTLEPVVLDAVTNSGKVDVGSLAAALLEPGESRSIHQLATILVDSGRLEGALNTVKNKIEGAFLRSQTYGDRRYTLTTTRGKKAVKVLSCELVNLRPEQVLGGIL
jgi:RecA-family ATPase